MTPDLAPAIYAALTGNSDILDALATYQGAAAVFTRRPLPADASYPLIVSSGDVALGDQDMITTEIPVIMRDVSVFGLNDTPAHYRAVESIARDVRALFHRQRSSLLVDGFDVIDILASGPIIGPTDDDMTVHRLVTLTVRLTPSG